MATELGRVWWLFCNFNFVEIISNFDLRSKVGGTSEMRKILSYIFLTPPLSKQA